MFDTKHVIILVITFALIVGLFFLTRKWSLKKKYQAFLGVAILSEIVKILFYIVKNEEEFGGVLPKSDLPFQLCSIQILFTLFVLFTKNEKLRRAVIAFMMPSGLIGGLAAILIPTSSSLNYLPITLQYFIYHAALITLAAHLLTDKELRFSFQDYCYCLLFILCLLFFSIYINSMLYDTGTGSNVNFMYVVSPPVDGLPFLNEEHGWLVYFFHYLTIVLAAITLCYIKPIFLFIKEKLQKPTATKSALEKEAPPLEE